MEQESNGAGYVLFARDHEAMVLALDGVCPQVSVPVEEIAADLFNPHRRRPGLTIFPDMAAAIREHGLSMEEGTPYETWLQEGRYVMAQYRQLDDEIDEAGCYGYQLQRLLTWCEGRWQVAWNAEEFTEPGVYFATIGRGSMEIQAVLREDAEWFFRPSASEALEEALGAYPVHTDVLYACAQEVPRFEDLHLPAQVHQVLLRLPGKPNRYGCLPHRLLEIRTLAGATLWRRL